MAWSIFNVSGGYRTTFGYSFALDNLIPSRGGSGRRHTNEGPRHLVKMNLYFTFEFPTCVDLFSTSIGLKACSNLIQNENSKS